MKKTDWFMPEIKPVRPGVYETTDAPDALDHGHTFADWSAFQYWDGEQWGCIGHMPASAFRDRGDVSIYQEHAWRGLSKEPK